MKEERAESMNSALMKGSAVEFIDRGKTGELIETKSSPVYVWPIMRPSYGIFVARGGIHSYAIFKLCA